MQLRDLLLFDTRFFYPLVTVEHFLIVPFYLHCTRAVFTSSRFYQVKKNQSLLDECQKEKKQKKEQSRAHGLQIPHTHARRPAGTWHTYVEERDRARGAKFSQFFWQCVHRRITYVRKEARKSQISEKLIWENT